MKVLYDIETDDLLPGLTKMHLLVAHDLTNDIRYEFLEGDEGWRKILDNATTVIGHNIISFDNMALRKLFNYEFPRSVNFHDTMLMSQILDYMRFGYGGHSLQVWGEYLNFPKGEIDSYEVYTEEMRVYGNRDVDLNAIVYQVLLDEFKSLFQKVPYIKTYMQAEHYAARWQAEAQFHGWPFDKEGAEVLFAELDVKLTEIRDKLEPLLGWKSIVMDKEFGEVIVKSPKWVKSGVYHSHTATWFDIPPECGSDILEPEEIVDILENAEDFEDSPLLPIAAAIATYGYRPIEGDFCRVDFAPRSLSSPADVKVFLFKHGWVPSEWNTKKDEETGEIKNTSPKIIDEDLELLGGDGQLYNEFKSMSSRHSIVNTWIEEVDENGMLHGESMHVGTPSMRVRHQIIVNVPTPEKPYGTEMRKLFKAMLGWKLVGCDSAGNQARGLAFYLKNKEFLNVILNEDIHEYNKDKLNEVLVNLGFEPVCERHMAKRILYAFLFGASGGKIWSYIFDVDDSVNGNMLKHGFTHAVPGFKTLLDKLKEIYKATSRQKRGYGYIPGISGNRIYVDSAHKLLVYLLQSLEKATCSASVMLTMQGLEDAGIPYVPLIYYHDEEDFMVPEEYAEEAARIGKQAFVDGPRLFDIEIMDGDSKIGDTWYEIH